MKKRRGGSNTVPVNTVALRAERENKGWKQEDLADSTGLPVSTISRIERSGKAYVSTLRIIAEGLGVEIEKLSLRTAGNLPNEKKGAGYTYFLDMRKLLAWNEKEVKAQWFRKSGPIAADIQAGFTYPCSMMLKALRQLVHINRLSILEGDVGSGKSVLVRLLAYDHITQQPQVPVYFCSIKDHIQDLNYTVLRGEVERLTGLIIIEDIHLAARDIHQLLRDLSGEEKRTILLTTRASIQEDNLNGRGGMLENSRGLAPRLQITPDEYQISHIIEQFSSVNDIHLNSKDRLSIKEECKNNLWLLSYALMGCYDNRGKGNPLQWIAAGIKHDFEEIESAGCNPEVLLALSPLYMHEVPTADEYLTQELGIKPEDIKKLLKRREIFKVVEKHRVYYRLPHATLAKVYWEFKDDINAAFLTRLKQKEFQEDSINYIYHYATYRNKHNSGLPNGLTAILRMDYPAKTLLLQQLDVNRKTINTIMSDTNVESFYEWLQAYGFYITQNPTSNIIVELMKPILAEEQNGQLEIVNHQVIKEMSLLLTTSDNREKLKRSISRISKNNIDPNDICQLLSFLSYIDRSLMDEFWISKGRELLSTQILSLEIYKIAQIVAFLFGIERHYGLKIWHEIKPELKIRLNDIRDDMFIPKAIGLLRLYLPENILPAYLAMYNTEDIISKITLLNEGFCRDYYISVFSLFDDEYKDRLKELFDADSFVRNMHQADLIELSICIKYLFTTYSENEGKLHLLDYDAMSNRFDNESNLDGVLRIIEAVHKISSEAGRKLCRKLHVNKISEKIRKNAFCYKTKNQFVSFVSYIDQEIGDALQKASREILTNK